MWFIQINARSEIGKKSVKKRQNKVFFCPHHDHAGLHRMVVVVATELVSTITRYNRFWWPIAAQPGLGAGCISCCWSRWGHFHTSRYQGNQVEVRFSKWADWEVFTYQWYNACHNLCVGSVGWHRVRRNSPASCTTPLMLLWQRQAWTPTRTCRDSDNLTMTCRCRTTPHQA